MPTITKDKQRDKRMYCNNKQLAFGDTVKNATVQQLETLEVDLTS